MRDYREDILVEDNFTESDAAFEALLGDDLDYFMEKARTPVASVMG